MGVLCLNSEIGHFRYVKKFSSGICCFYYFYRDAKVFTLKSKDRIGQVYKKTVYREFTDGTFQQQKPHRRDLGILGPVIRGEIGDTLKVVFKVSGK